MKDYVKQFISSFQGLLQNVDYRFSNPLGGAFLFSWIIFNAQAVYYFLLSDDKIKDKIIYLKEIYVIDENNIQSVDYDLLLIYPVFSALVFLVASPVISNIATGTWSFLDKTLSSKRMELVDKHVLLTEEDKVQMNEGFKKVKSSFQLRIRELEGEVSALKNLIVLDDSIETKNDINISNNISLNNDVIGEHIAPNLSIEDIRSKMNKVTNKHNIQLWIASLYDYDLDNGLDKIEIENIFYLFYALLEDRYYMPASSLRFGNRTIDRNKIISLLGALIKKGYVTDESEKGYSYSELSIFQLSEICNDALKLAS